MQTTNTSFKKILTAIILLIAVFFLYETWCPLERIIGIPCPGCNMLSALYHLLHGDIEVALYFHPLVIVFCVYVFLEVILYIKFHHFKTKYAHYLRIIFLVLLLIIYIYRMIIIFPNYPMAYNDKSFLGVILNLIN